MASKAKEASALIGAPPNNERDTNIIRGWYRGYGMTDADPSLGMIFTAKRPDNYVYESKQAGMIVGMVVVILVIVTSTVARLFARTRGKHTKFGADDWVIIAAAILAVVYPILQIVMVVQAGGGRHTFDNTYGDYQTLAYYLAVCKYLFYPTVGLIKISIALFVRRIADRASKLWRLLADIFIATVVAFIISSVFWNVFICNPPRSAWDKEYAGSLETPPVCLDMALNSLVLGTIHTVQGFLLLTAPIIILWKVKMDTGKKMRLFVIWAAGAVTVTGGLLQQVTSVITDDTFWQYSGVLVWTSLDISMGILTACLPVLDGAIMGSWRAAKTKLSSSGPHGSGTHVLSSDTNNHLTRGTHTKSVARTQSKKEYSESIEDIIQKEDGTELAILRTDEVRLDYETADFVSPPAMSKRHSRFE